MDRHIFLIGMPGCGKSSLGKKSASYLGLNYIDTDQRIERVFGMPTSQIFRRYGEQAFRNAETNMLIHITREPGAIVSTGGGMVLREVQEIPQRERAGEYLMLRLRTSLGIDPQEYEKLFLLPFAPLEDVLEQRRRSFHATQNDSGHWVLTPKGYLVSNDIITDLLIAQDESHPLKRI